MGFWASYNSSSWFSDVLYETKGITLWLKLWSIKTPSRQKSIDGIQQRVPQAFMNSVTTASTEKYLLFTLGGGVMLNLTWSIWWNHLTKN